MPVKKYLPILIIVAVVAVAGAFFALKKDKPASSTTANEPQSRTSNTTSASNQTTSNAASQTPSNSTTKPPATQTTVVSISDFAFSPAQITVKKGTKVTWVNKDTIPHTVTSDSGSTTLESGTLQSGASFSFTFNDVGTYNYHCSIHNSMKGSVVVTD